MEEISGTGVEGAASIVAGIIAGIGVVVTGIPTKSVMALVPRKMKCERGASQGQGPACQDQ